MLCWITNKLTIIYFAGIFKGCLSSYEDLSKSFLEIQLDSVVDFRVYNRSMVNGLKIGELAKRTGLNIETIRFYERSGLLESALRAPNGYRLFEPQTIERIEFIKKSQLLGFSLDEIREVIDHKRQGASPCMHVRAAVKKKLEDLDDRIIRMQQYRDELKATLAEWDKEGVAEGHVCGLIERSNIKAGPKKNRRKEHREITK